jgi:hypothetical protein
MLSAREFEAVPDDKGNRAEWHDDDPNRNIKHAEAARSVTTLSYQIRNVQASMRLVFSKGNIGLEKAFAAFVPRVSCRGRRYWDWADPSR